jgi:hypothetical protein
MKKTEPVLLAFIVPILTCAGSAVLLLASDHTLEGILVAVGTFLGSLGAAFARNAVSPTKE